jgi:uncharacterized protein
MAAANTAAQAAPSRGRLANSGNGPTLIPIDIGHDAYVGLIDPHTAFWSLIKKDHLAETLADETFLSAYREKSAAFSSEMHNLRFGLGLTAVYINVTERCNLNCSYCYIPEELRRGGSQMSSDDLFRSLDRLHTYFSKRLPEGRRPQMIFHGAEPLLCRDTIFAAMERFGGAFRFGVQTNGTLLDAPSVAFLKQHGVGVGLSLDGPLSEIADRTRKTWAGSSVFAKTLAAMDLLRGYAGHNVICTVTRENMAHLQQIVDFFHDREVPATMLNMVRCTLPGARAVKPADHEVFPHFQAALERTHELFKRTGRKLVVANFANILISILAPTARRLMCDISPCGGGRVFFALAPDGGMYPCSEFIGLPEFCGGNLLRDEIDAVLLSPPFRKVTGRKVEDISPCDRCVIRHFCGSPCPAEAHEMNGGMHRTGAFCEFYEEQVRYALRLIADGRADDFLWDGWDKDTETLFDAAMIKDNIE